MNRFFARIALFGAADGGRSQAIPIMNFGCPAFFQNVPALASHGYDCRLLLPEYGQPISPGEIAERVPMIFLSADEVGTYLKPGVKFTLWEGRTIAEGEILESA